MNIRHKSYVNEHLNAFQKRYQCKLHLKIIRREFANFNKGSQLENELLKIRNESKESENNRHVEKFFILYIKTAFT